MVMAILPLVASGFLISNQTKETLTQDAVDKANIFIENVDKYINLFIKQKTNTVRALAETEILRSSNKDEITKFLVTITNNDTDFVRFYIADINGNFYTAPYDIATDDFNNVSEENWFKEAINTGKIYISPPQRDVMSSRFIIDISYPIMDNDNVIGVLNGEVQLNSLTVMFLNMNIGREGHAFLTDNQGFIIAHADPSKPMSNVNIMDEPYVKEALAGNSGFGTYKVDNESAFIAYSMQADTKWGIFVQQPEREAFAQVSRVSSVIFSSALMIGILSLLIGILLGNIIANPIIRLVRIAKNVAEGNLREEIKVKDKTEIGALATAFNQMVESLRLLVQEVVKAAENISASSQELAAGSEQSTQSSQQVAKAVEQIAAGASEQVQKLTDISDMIQKLVEANGKMEEKARFSANSAEQMATDAIDSQNKMNVTTEKMELIKSSVEKSYTFMEELNNKISEIGNISSIIKEIVDQTNLLALNASIEAARAGEHGRGFAVVADEVRKLADQSGGAAKQIAEIVKQIQKSSKIVVDAMAESDKQVDEGRSLIVETNAKINGLMEQFQSVAQNARDTLEEIASQNKKLEDILQMAQNISVISQETAAGTEEVSASAEEQTATMESIEASAQELAKLAENLTSLVNRFNV